MSEDFPRLKAREVFDYKFAELKHVFNDTTSEMWISAYADGYQAGKLEGVKEKAKEILEKVELLHVESTGDLRAALEDLMHELCQPSKEPE